MMWGHQSWTGPWLWILLALIAMLVAGLVLLLVAVFSSPSEESSETAGRSLRKWLGPMAIAVAVLVVATLGVALAAARSAPWAPAKAQPTCIAPDLPGSTLDVTLADMGGMMGGRMPSWRNGQLMPGAGTGMMGSGGGMMGSSTPLPYGRMMTVMVGPAEVGAGTVSFRVWNTGTITHEFVIMPMPPGGPGSRPVGSDGKVSEDGSLGEASRSCAAGTGEGIEPGALGWVTVRLAPGSYELICNLPGHYAMGMYTGLTVT
ncbi:MAG: sulfocyanin-like copper-binding protein [Actinomycetota bacterium]